MEPQKLEEFRQALESDREQILKQMQALSKDQRRVERSLSSDSREQSQEVENDEVIDGLVDHDKNKLELVESALARIQSGAFGRCLSCGEEISASRLNAVPYAGQCLNCQQEKASA